MTDLGLIAAGLCALHRIMTWLLPNVPLYRHEVCDQKRLQNSLTPWHGQVCESELIVHKIAGSRET